MKSIEELTSDEITSMNYNQLIGVVKETNRPPGGKNTLRTVYRECNLNKDSSVLEIGTSTGFTAIEIARDIGSKVTAIDINSQSLEEARLRADISKVSQNIDFKIDDATNLSFKDNSFDLVFCGNVTSYVPSREKALSEYTRVLRNGGVLVAVPMYYLRKPSSKLTKEISEAMGSQLSPEYKPYWQSFFNHPNLELEFLEDYKFNKISNERVNSFVGEILSLPHLQRMNSSAFNTLKSKYSKNISLFSKNLSLMGYSIMILRKNEHKMDSQLFTGSLVRGEAR